MTAITAAATSADLLDELRRLVDRHDGASDLDELRALTDELTSVLRRTRGRLKALTKREEPKITEENECRSTTTTSEMDSTSRPRAAQDAGNPATTRDATPQVATATPVETAGQAATSTVSTMDGAPTPSLSRTTTTAPPASTGSAPPSVSRRSAKALVLVALLTLYAPVADRTTRARRWVASAARAGWRAIRRRLRRASHP